jgi:hypothetical protein
MRFNAFVLSYSRTKTTCGNEYCSCEEDFPPLRFALSIVYPSRRNLPPRTRIVIDYLTEVLQADPAMALHTSEKPSQSAANPDTQAMNKPR